jgi:branched-chain amino acid transport system permease protein
MNIVAQFLVNGIVAGSVYALIALSFALIFTATRIFHFTHGAIYTIAAFAGYAALVTFHLGTFAAFAAAILTAAILGMLINAWLYEPMRRLGVSSFVIMISSFGLLIILTHLTAIIWGTNPVVLWSGGQETVYDFEIFRLTGRQIGIVGLTSLTGVLLWIFFKYVRLGIAIRALGNDSELAAIHGMPVRTLRYLSFAVGSGLVGFGSLLIGFNVGIIDFNMGFDVILMATVAMIIGGLGNVSAAAAGGFLLGVIQNLALWKIDSKWQMALSFAILILILLFRPSGLFGEKQSAVGI